MVSLEVAMLAFVAGYLTGRAVSSIIEKSVKRMREKEAMNSENKGNGKVIYHQFRKKKSSWE